MEDVLPSIGVYTGVSVGICLGEHVRRKLCASTEAKLLELEDQSSTSKKDASNRKEKEIKSLNEVLTRKQAKAGFVGVILMVTIVTSLRSQFANTPILYLTGDVPFPLNIVTHTGLSGSDYSEVSWWFIFFLASALTRWRVVDQTMRTVIFDNLRVVFLLVTLSQANFFK